MARNAAGGIALTVLLWSISTSSFSQSSDGIPDPTIHQLLKESQFEELQSAIEEAQNAYRLDPRSEHQLDVLLDQFYRPIHWMDSPLSEWVDALDTSEAFLARGIFYTAMGWSARGSAYISRTSENQLLGMREYFSLALTDLQESAIRDPEQVHVYCYFIDILMNFGDQATEAIEDAYDAAIAVNPLSLTARWFYLNSVRPRWGGSIAEMERVIEDAQGLYDQNPALRVLDGRLFSELSESMREKRDYPAALTMADAAIESGGEYWAYFDIRGDLRKSLGDYEGALEDYTKALLLRPNYAPSLMGRADANFVLWRRDDGIRDITRVIDLGAGTPQRHATRGSAYLRQGRVAEAQADLNIALSMGGQDNPIVGDLQERLRAHEGTPVQ